jgi:hypothetical protein
MTPSNIHVAPFQSSKGISKARELSVPDGGNIHGGWMVKKLLARYRAKRKRDFSKTAEPNGQRSRVARRRQVQFS